MNEKIWEYVNGNGQRVSMECVEAQPFAGMAQLRVEDRDQNAELLLDARTILGLHQMLQALVPGAIEAIEDNASIVIFTSEDARVEPILLDEEGARRCGIGQEADCCAYLILGPHGHECGRQDVEVVMQVETRIESMTAKRRPEAPYPECQL